MIASLASTALSQASPYRYRVIDLGSIGSPLDLHLVPAQPNPDEGGGEHTLGINDDGWIVGGYETAGGDVHAFLWLPSATSALAAGFHDLHTLANLPANVSSYANDVNNDGRVVGHVGDLDSSGYAAYFAVDTYTGFGTLAVTNLHTTTGPFSVAHALNESQNPIVVGTTTRSCPGGSELDFVRNGFHMELFRIPLLQEELFPDTFIQEAFAFGVNGVAQYTVAGRGEDFNTETSTPCDEEQQPLSCLTPTQPPYEWDVAHSFNPIELDALQANPIAGAVARDVNDAEKIVGYGWEGSAATCTQKAIVWQGTTVDTVLGDVLPAGQLGDNSRAEALTESSPPCVTVAGWNVSVNRALLWDGSALTGWCVADLNDITLRDVDDVSTGCLGETELLEARGVNAYRHIITVTSDPGVASSRRAAALTCAADLTEDFKVNSDDRVIFYAAYQCSPCSQDDLDADLDCDGDVDNDDLAIFLASWSGDDLCTVNPLCNCFGGGESANGGDAASDGSGNSDTLTPLNAAVAYLGFDSPAAFLDWCATAEVADANAYCAIVSELLVN